MRGMTEVRQLLKQFGTIIYTGDPAGGCGVDDGRGPGIKGDGPDRSTNVSESDGGAPSTIRPNPVPAIRKVKA
jgi:hypothetical protein